MSKFEELCKAYAAARKQSIEYKHSCQDFADFLVHRMSLYFECPIETGEMHVDEDGYLLFEIAMTLYENPQEPNNSAQEKVSFSLSIRKKRNTFVVSVYPYGNNFTIPRDDLNKLDEIYEFINKTIADIYEEKLKLWLGEEASIDLGIPF
ncbi:hypothetical protein [Microseira wollei]|uniref:Uncharacterized protein n=1 Tax=Microseira wollei NIES-4236 TaxID=2530354 RepID=A0AAV3XAG5_9CYAN|nr:hypothetical protein [Microseira wollei]GET39153.1 hypothetical protein MiSe_39170 [Microseira wollei NIES-4236]